MENGNGSAGGSVKKGLIIGIVCAAAAVVIVSVVVGMRFWMFRNTMNDLINGRLENTGIISRFWPGGVDEDIGESIRESIEDALDENLGENIRDSVRLRGEDIGGLGERLWERLGMGGEDRAMNRAVQEYVGREGGAAKNIADKLNRFVGEELRDAFMYADGNTIAVKMNVYLTQSPQGGEAPSADEPVYDDFRRTITDAAALGTMAEIVDVIQSDVLRKTGYMPEVEISFCEPNYGEQLYSYGDGEW